jgi:rhodanese-related sulfurtransferase
MIGGGVAKDYRQMDNRQLRQFLQQGGALVDIRRKKEWQLTGVVEGSLLLTFFAADGSSEPMQWLGELEKQVPPEAPLALICRTGQRTTVICEFLQQVFPERELYNITAGIYGWLTEGFPVVTPKFPRK